MSSERSTWISDPGLILFVLGWICLLIPNFDPTLTLDAHWAKLAISSLILWSIGCLCGLLPTRFRYRGVGVTVNALSLIGVVGFVFWVLIFAANAG